jgi:hypothetical protein
MKRPKIKAPRNGRLIDAVILKETATHVLVEFDDRKRSKVLKTKLNRLK